MFSEKEAQSFVEQLQQVARDEVKAQGGAVVNVVPATVISVSGDTAVVRLAYAPSNGSGDFTVPIVTRQSITAGNAVNIAYWSNLSTAILLSRG